MECRLFVFTTRWSFSRFAHPELKEQSSQLRHDRDYRRSMLFAMIRRISSGLSLILGIAVIVASYQFEGGRSGESGTSLEAILSAGHHRGLL